MNVRGLYDGGVEAFLLRLARLLLGGGLSARDVETEVIAAGRALGYPDVQVAALPTGVFVGLSPDAPVQFSAAKSYIRFDQLSEFLSITARLRAGDLPADQACELLESAAAKRAPWSYGVANLGSILVGVGLVALLCPTWPTVAAGLIGSALVAGLATIAGRVKAMAEFLPVIAGFLVSYPILLAADAGWLDYPFRTIVAVLAILFPGSVFVTGLADLVAGHSSAGTARLAAALMQFTLFFVGIALAVMAAGHQLSELLDIAAPAWPFGIKLVGVILATIGIMVFCYCPLRHAASIIALSGVAGALQVYLGGEVSPALGGLVAALVASVGAQALARVGPPWHVTYLPAFMIVAPGSFAFMTASQVSGYSASPLVSAGSAFLGVAVGTLLGGAIKELEFSKTLARGVRRRRA